MLSALSCAVSWVPTGQAAAGLSLLLRGGFERFFCALLRVGFSFCLSGSRRRISLSCERLRALLPQFDGRREDMASVLEMSVYFLQLAHCVEPSWGPLSVSCVQAGLRRPLQRSTALRDILV